MHIMSFHVNHHIQFYQPLFVIYLGKHHHHPMKHHKKKSSLAVRRMSSKYAYQPKNVQARNSVVRFEKSSFNVSTDLNLSFGMLTASVIILR